MNSIQKLIIVFIPVLFFSLQINLSRVFAQDETFKPDKQSIYPGSMLYPFKRLAEKVQVTLTIPKSSKIELHQSLLRKRISELSYLVENKNINPIERSSQRFSYQAGVLIETLEKDEDSKDKKGILKDFESYKPLLSKLRDYFEANSSNWLLLQQNIDTLDILSKKVS